MRELYLSWSQWKSAVAGQDFPQCYVESPGFVDVLSGSKEWLLRVTLPVGGEDHTEWVASYKSAQTAESLVDDAIATVVADFRAQPITSSGIPATTVLVYPELAEDLRQTWLITAPPETLVIKDIWIGGDLVGPENICFMAGGAYEIWTKADMGSVIQFLMVDRDNVSGAFPFYGLQVSKLPSLTSMTGTFVVGEYVKGGTSNAKTKVLAVGGSSLDVRFWVQDDDGNDSAFTAGETITGLTSGATAVLDGTTPFDEGDVLPLRKPFLKDEWIYHPEGSPIFPVLIQPGGSKPVPGGYYFRVVQYNANTVGDFIMKASLIMATR